MADASRQEMRKGLNEQTCFGFSTNGRKVSEVLWTRRSAAIGLAWGAMMYK